MARSHTTGGWHRWTRAGSWSQFESALATQTTAKTAQKAPARSTGRASLRASSLASLARAVLAWRDVPAHFVARAATRWLPFTSFTEASSGPDRARGPFHSHPAGWTGRGSLPAGRASVPLPAVWVGAPLSAGRASAPLPAVWVSAPCRLDGPANPFGRTGRRPRPARGQPHASPADSLTRALRALVHSSLARFG